MDLTGKLALVTGASGDIGGAIARAIGAAGAHVVATYVGAEEAAAATVAATSTAAKTATTGLAGSGLAGSPG